MAQAETESYSSERLGITIEYPADWYRVEGEASPGVYVLTFSDSQNTMETTQPNVALQSGQFIITIYEPVNAANPMEIIEGLQSFTAPENLQYFDDPAEITLATRDAATLPYENFYSTGFLIAWETPSGGLLYANVDAAPGEMIGFEKQALQVLATADVVELVLPESGEVLDLTQQADLVDVEFSMQYPEDWLIIEDANYGYVLSTHEAGVDAIGIPGSVVAVLVFEALADVMPPELGTDLTLEEIMEAFATGAEQAGQLVLEPEIFTVDVDEDEIEIGQLTFLNDDVRIFVKITGPGQILRMITFANPDEMVAYLPTLHAVAASAVPMTTTSPPETD